MSARLSFGCRRRLRRSSPNDGEEAFGGALCGQELLGQRLAANHWGAALVCPRTGLALDAAMGWFNAHPGAANSIAPGKRPLANMGPILLSRAGEPVAALGACYTADGS